MPKDYEPKKMKKIPFTGIRRVLEKANKLENQGRSVIHFEVGQPDFDTPDNIKAAVKKALDDGYTSYTSNYGYPVLRNAIAEKLLTMNGIKADPAEIMVTAGGEEAVAAVIASLIEAGDEVIIADPGYIPYSSLIKMNQGVPVTVPLIEEENFAFDLAYMESVITDKTKMVILSTPGNPTGTMMGKETLHALAEICKKYDLLVLADEAYEQVTYDGNQHISIASLSEMYDRTITVQSFSKTYSMCGFRIGYAVAPPHLMRIIIRAHQTIVMSANSFAQMGAVEALKGPQDSLHNMLKEFDRRRIMMYEGLQDLGIPCRRPQAAFYLFPDISQFGLDSFTFAEELLDKYGVATVPGVEFGAAGENHLRISYANSYENCAEGLRRIAEYVKELRNRKGAK